ncbi:unnamed protein product [Toxocara canis]|uniref:EGF-like domain-containing protein n=1 Tax=Toxocara canis TaxID=6265 RepID=A0A183UJZ6_TOXCA|nr:unnamed protein product [Toxocara canis]
MFGFRLSFFLALIKVSLTVRLDDNEHCDGDGLTVGCRSHQELSHMISHLKREVYRLQAPVDPNCTVCWSAPCLNGGTCIPLNVTEYRYLQFILCFCQFGRRLSLKLCERPDGVNCYRCDCPPDYSGKICQTHMECKPDTCGANAKCFVAHHQINCACLPGFTGDPWKGCTMKTVSACMSGDPHYTTFDGQHFDYMGTCPYVFVEPCNNTLPKPYNYFSVKAKNERPSPQSHVSYVREVEVEMYGQKMHVDCSYNFLFNGIRTKMAFFYPNKENAKISVSYDKGTVTIENDQHIRVKFQCYYLCVEIPDEPPLHGADVLCGLAGNRDFDCRDDFRKKNGFVYEGINSCDNYRKEFTEEYGDSYITEDFLPLTPHPELCMKGVEVTNGSINCEFAEAKQKCQPILEASKGQGPFAKCQSLGDAIIQDAFDNCAYDICQNSTSLCVTFAHFAKVCQTHIPDTPLDWRGELGCSAINCPLNSTFKPCATGCPLTCSSPNYSPHCDKVCTEGCECDPTFVLDNSDPRHPKCVHVEDCGCIDPQGNYHPAGDQWLTDNCTKVNLCVNGTYKSYRRPCSADGFCGVDEKFNHKCLCNKGYSGDGYNCADVDECLDKRTCSVDKNQGKCTNLPGSHICTCDVYYNDGDNCETFLPYRHCADLYTYHNIHEDGAYTIMPPYPFDGKPAFTTKDVYCDMTTQGGGWTLMSNSFTNSMSNKTYQQYVNGFGDAQIQDLWLGLEVIHQMSVQVDTSLRVDIYHCPTKWKPGQSTYCTYPLFKVHDAKSTYAVEIPVGCEGTENTYEDGWLRWDEQVGPIFSAYDSADSGCARYYHNTGWWYDSARLCGSANLNGNRYVCENTPVAGELTHFLKWNGNLFGGTEDEDASGNDLNRAFDSQISSSDDCPTGDHSMECRSKAELQEIIADLKKTIIAQQESINPNCTSCWSGPCMNGGKCTPIDASTYRYVNVYAQAGNNLSGRRRAAFAFANTFEKTFNSIVNRNPRVSCAQRTVTASMVGDPHYTTFDGRSFDYMGLCPHYFVVPCNDTLPPPFGRFVVKAKNTPPYSNAQVSNVDEMEVELYGLSLYSNVRTFDLFVNRISTTMPFFYPNKENAKVNGFIAFMAIRSKKSTALLLDTNILVRFNKRKLSVQMPDVEELRGSDILCGLAGNINSDCKDDLRKRDGTLLNSESCSSTTKVNEFGDSYIITEANHFISENGMIDNGPCKKGAEMGSPQNDCDMEEAKRLCKPIIDAKRGKGIFSRCMKLPVTEIDRSYEACVYDTCYGRAKGSDDKTFCNSLELFAEKCQLYLPNTPLKWRVRSGCDELQCPLHAIAKECASACPRTCHNPNPPIECNEPCSEGCECEPGFYLDDSDPIKSVCIPLEECGCNDENGNHHAAAETWVNENCSTISHCDKGIAKTEAKNCSANAVCAIHSTALVRRCICKEAFSVLRNMNKNVFHQVTLKGFEGDGYTCDDIDECADPQTCNAGLGHGKCNNTPGSYVCKCHPDYDSDPNCQYYRPRRHCADLFKYHNIVKSGVYNIRPFSSIDGPEADIMISVYCDMTTEGGGWTLMSGSLSDSMSNKTFDEYVTGFGDPAIKDVWLGLDIIHQMTVNEDTSLRVNLHYCAKRLKQKNLKMNIPARSTYCTYPSFKVHNRSRQYVVEIPYACEGTDESNEDDGWVRWDGKYGPKFTAYDSANGNFDYASIYVRRQSNKKKKHQLAHCRSRKWKVNWNLNMKLESENEIPMQLYCRAINVQLRPSRAENEGMLTIPVRDLNIRLPLLITVVLTKPFSATCSKFYRNTGWWFDDEDPSCGSANLNGNRYKCEARPNTSEIARYLKWNSNCVGKAELFLRPSNFDEHKLADQEALEDEGSEAQIIASSTGLNRTAEFTLDTTSEYQYPSPNQHSAAENDTEKDEKANSTLAPVNNTTNDVGNQGTSQSSAQDETDSIFTSRNWPSQSNDHHEQNTSTLRPIAGRTTYAQHDNSFVYAANDTKVSVALSNELSTAKSNVEEQRSSILDSMISGRTDAQHDNPSTSEGDEYARDVLESSSVLHLKGTEQPDKPTSESIFTESSNAQHYSSFASAVRGNLPDALSGRLQPPLNETDQRNKLTTESTEGTEGFTGEDQFPSKTAKRAEMTTTEEIASTEQTAMQTKITTQPQVATTRWEGRTSEHRVSGTTKMSFTGSARRVTRDWKNEATLRRRPEDIEWTTREAIIDLTAIEDY